MAGIGVDSMMHHGCHANAYCWRARDRTIGFCRGVALAWPQRLIHVKSGALEAATAALCYRGMHFIEFWPPTPRATIPNISQPCNAFCFLKCILFRHTNIFQFWCAAQPKHFLRASRLEQQLIKCGMGWWKTGFSITFPCNGLRILGKFSAWQNAHLVPDDSWKWYSAWNGNSFHRCPTFDGQMVCMFVYDVRAPSGDSFSK